MQAAYFGKLGKRGFLKRQVTVSYHSEPKITTKKLQLDKSGLHYLDRVILIYIRFISFQPD